MTITAVARRAGVSIATVSRVINGSAKVSPQTAEQVREAIEALNFYPDTNARALGSGRSSLYGLIISDITNPFFPELVKAFEDIAVAHQQEVLIANTDYDPKRMELCVSRMLQRKVDGVAIMTSEMDERLVEVFSHRRVPLVFLDTATVPAGVSSIRIDYDTGVALAMEHLTGLGHTRIAFITGPLWLHSAQIRKQAFEAAMQHREIAVAEHMIQSGNHRADGGFAAMERILAVMPLPTAVFCSNDLTAIGAMGAIHARGLRIPEDISILGYDDILLSSYTRPALTTLRISRTEIAATAFRSLFHRRGQPIPVGASDQTHVISPELIKRSSTGRVAAIA
jgi:DNA-binding LacI/PurR family transcriptional regulator